MGGGGVTIYFFFFINRQAGIGSFVLKQLQRKLFERRRIWKHSAYAYTHHLSYNIFYSHPNSRVLLPPSSSHNLFVRKRSLCCWRQLSWSAAIKSSHRVLYLSLKQKILKLLKQSTVIEHEDKDKPNNQRSELTVLLHSWTLTRSHNTHKLLQQWIPSGDTVILPRNRGTLKPSSNTPPN